MSLLTNIFAGGAGEIIEKVGGVVDNLTTSKEEKLQLKNELEKILHDANKTAQEAVTSRWEADMKSDNWLTKNIRPLVLIFLTAVFVIMSFSFIPAFSAPPPSITDKTKTPSGDS